MHVYMLTVGALQVTVTCLKPLEWSLTISKPETSTPDLSSSTQKVRTQLLALSCFNLLFAELHIKCFAAKCTVSVNDVYKQLKVMLDGSAIKVLIETD